MFKEFIYAIEYQASLRATQLTAILQFFWLVKMSVSVIFQGGPRLDYRVINAEFLMPMLIAVIGTIALFWRVLGRWVLGSWSNNESFWMEHSAFRHALWGAGVMAILWLVFERFDATMMYLTGYVLYLSMLTMLVRAGPLTNGVHRRMRTGTGTGAQQREDGSTSVARAVVPKVSFKDVHGNADIKARLKEAAQAVVARRGGERTARNGILLTGKPGNGKTMFVEALAGELKLPLLQLTYGDVASPWVGEKSARINAAFAQARRQQPCVLFIDEVDSFLSSRDGEASNGVKEDRDVVNALLTLMVDIRKERVILVAATNHMARLDAAGVREGRFDFKVEITPPDAEARVGLLKLGLKTNLPKANVDAAVIESVARRWNGYSAKRILAVTEELGPYLRRAGRVTPAYEDFMGALRALQGRKGVLLENVKALDDLVLSPSTRESLDLIAGRMADPRHTEAHGGTLPTGVLFYGPPGTGKTATAKALAKSIDWAFLTATGADLARNPAELQKLHDQANELRPCVIFVDEADELLRSRDLSPYTEGTNKLLTILDGVGDRVKDVVWIAATNNPEQIDPALLRGGRFTEKVPFERPSAKGLSIYLEAWFASRKVHLAGGLSIAAVAHTLKGQSIANAEAVAQAALNRAISRRGAPVVVTSADIEQAVHTVL
jgi:transitional endoplasmic reticulum ATPase